MSTPEMPVLTKNNGPGAFPSSRLDSHRNFEPFWLGYVDFCQFPTRFVQILMFSSPNALSARAKFALVDNQPPSWGSFNGFYRREQNLLSEIIGPSSWGSFNGFYRREQNLLSEINGPPGWRPLSVRANSLSETTFGWGIVKWPCLFFHKQSLTVHSTL